MWFILKPEHDINIMNILVGFSNTETLDFKVCITHYKFLNRMLSYSISVFVLFYVCLYY